MPRKPPAACCCALKTWTGIEASRSSDAAISDDLEWLEIRFDPAIRRQSDHASAYAGPLRRLEAAGLAYPCFCSRADVARAAAGRDPDDAPLYGGACRALSLDERAARLAHGDKAAWRLDVATALGRLPAPLQWTEFGEGRVAEERRADPQAWGDVVLRGRDLEASYHLAVTVDDALQGVSDVVRGRDLLTATAVHRLLQALLDLPAPRYRHHRLVLDSSGAKLSKRRSSPSLIDLRAQGFSASDIRAALGFGAGSAAGLRPTIR